jgi:hypothetical protein
VSAAAHDAPQAVRGDARVFDGLVAQRLVAVFVGGWLLFTFPLLTLWDRQTTLFGLPLFPTALFIAWAALIVAVALIVDRAEEP